MRETDRSGVYWVGTYIAPAKLSINAYLVFDEYPTLVNAGAPITTAALMRKVESVVPVSELQYLVLNQVDIAYAGGLNEIAHLAPQARVVTSEYEAVKLGLFGLYIQPLVIENGDVLAIGKRRLQFRSAPFAGSPDAVFAFEETEGILFSGEAFSTTVSKWDLVTDQDLTELLEAYWDTHIGESASARSAIAELRGLDIRLIAPGHGPMLRQHIGKYIEALSGGLGKAA